MKCTCLDSSISHAFDGKGKCCYADCPCEQFEYIGVCRVPDCKRVDGRGHDAHDAENDAEVRERRRA